MSVASVIVRSLYRSPRGLAVAAYICAITMMFPVDVAATSWTSALAGQSMEQVKPHEAFWLENRGREMPPRRPSLFPMAPAAAQDGGGDRIVYGYLPYWEIGYDAFPWELLTHIAYFSAEIDSQGNVVDANHWYQPQVESLIADAHAHGVYVTLTVTQFDNDAIANILMTPAIRNSLIDTLVAMVLDRGADGVSIDFEFVPVSAKSHFVAFMADLTEAMHSAIPHSHVSYAGPSVDWSGAYDYDALASACDGVFIMAYGYHWSGGSPGPTSPLTAGSSWSKWSVSWTVEDYLTWGGPLIRSRMILGLPLYGRDWPTVNATVPGTATGSGTSVVYMTGQAKGKEYGWKWDADSQTPYYVYQTSGQWHQGWVDTPQSLGIKFAYAAEQELGGIGFWALGYDEGDSAMWEQVAAYFPPLPPTIPGDDVGGEPDAGGGDVEGGGGDVTEAEPEADALTDVASSEDASVPLPEDALLHEDVAMDSGIAPEAVPFADTGASGFPDSGHQDAATEGEGRQGAGNLDAGAQNGGSSIPDTGADMGPTGPALSDSFVGRGGDGGCAHRGDRGLLGVFMVALALVCTRQGRGSAFLP